MTIENIDQCEECGSYGCECSCPSPETMQAVANALKAGMDDNPATYRVTGSASLGLPPTMMTTTPGVRARIRVSYYKPLSKWRRRFQLGKS